MAEDPKRHVSDEFDECVPADWRPFQDKAEED
jgi:hypothetical protein